MYWIKQAAVGTITEFVEGGGTTWKEVHALLQQVFPNFPRSAGIGQKSYAQVASSRSSSPLSPKNCVQTVVPEGMPRSSTVHSAKPINDVISHDSRQVRERVLMATQQKQVVGEREREVDKDGFQSVQTSWKAGAGVGVKAGIDLSNRFEALVDGEMDEQHNKSRHRSSSSDGSMGHAADLAVVVPSS